MKVSKSRLFLLIAVFSVLGLYVGNASWLASSQPDERLILAHRGLHQTYNPIGLKTMDCTASIIDAPVHDYLENTLQSIRSAIDYGADIIEVDIHPTTDGEFIVFHDWELSCRTNGEGVVRKQSTAYLKSLDIGYGYTADGGKTFPFRGKHVGAMPTLGEVFEAFPKARFLINIKGNKIEEAQQLTDYLNAHEFSNRERLSVYGSGVNVPKFAELNPDIVTLSKQLASSCLKKYLLTGWSGHVPQECQNSYIPIPRNYQWLVWGWPNRFENRLKKVGSKPMLMGDHIKGKANSGIDDIASIPANFGGIVFTNRIDIVWQKQDYDE